MVTYSDTENVEGAYHSQIPRGILPVKQRNPGTSCMDVKVKSKKSLFGKFIIQFAA